LQGRRHGGADPVCDQGPAECVEQAFQLKNVLRACMHASACVCVCCEHGRATFKLQACPCDEVMCYIDCAVCSNEGRSGLLKLHCSCLCACAQDHGVGIGWLNFVSMDCRAQAHGTSGIFMKPSWQMI
jgi:hypothetical protein